MSFQNTNIYSLIFNEGIYIIPESNNIRGEVGLPSSIAKASNEIEESVLPIENIPYIGKNKKHILIITHHIKENISNGEKEFLLKILGALKLTFEDVAIVNSDNLDIDSFKNSLNPSFIIAFTDSRTIDFLPEEKYTFSQVSSIQTLHADELAEIENDKAKKTLLWNSLKDVLMGI